MSSFVLDEGFIESVDSSVTESLGARRYAYQIDSAAACAAYGNCGCGLGGSCANSCVSGCADRGNCCSYGPR